MFETVLEMKFKCALAKKRESEKSGEKFFKSLAELSKMSRIDKEVFNQLLEWAAKALEFETEAAKNNLGNRHNKLKSALVENCDTDAIMLGVLMFCYSLFFPLSLGAGAIGAYALHNAILGIVTLSLGPWLLGALGVAAGLIGLLIAAYTVYGIYQGIRICNDSPQQEIEDFVEHIFQKQNKFVRSFGLGVKPVVKPEQDEDQPEQGSRCWF